jgi:hypothetical protein
LIIVSSDHHLGATGKHQGIFAQLESEARLATSSFTFQDDHKASPTITLAFHYCQEMTKTIQTMLGNEGFNPHP